jgi:hypothetical protein
MSRFGGRHGNNNQTIHFILTEHQYASLQGDETC